MPGAFDDRAAIGYPICRWDSEEGGCSTKRSPQGASGAALMPFAGYYSMSVGQGAFLVITALETYATDGYSLNVEVSISMNGEPPARYKEFEFDGVELSIPGTLSLEFTRTYDQGRLVVFTGQINGEEVSGSTYFNPVPLSAFLGSYKTVPTSARPAEPALAILNGSGGPTLAFNPGIFGDGDFQPVGEFMYDPSMYVLVFYLLDGSRYVMLGTGQGLVCGIQSGTRILMAENIPGAAGKAPPPSQSD